MSQKTAVSTVACPPGTLAGGPIRTRFFDGMFLTQADLETEQRYWRLKRRLTNRALGEGVVWGLRLEWKARNRTFALSPGYALDCCGNDLIVEGPIELSEQQLWTRADPSLRAGAGVRARSPDIDDHETNRDALHACVVLQYVECPEEARPVHRDACAGPTGSCEPSRIRESVRLLLVPPPAKPPPTPPQQFLDELYRWRDGLEPAIRDLLFPPQGTPPTAPASGLAPASVRVTIPGGPPALVTVQIPASGGASAPATLQATQTATPTRRTGVVTFELIPSSGWAFTGGRVTDQARVVETVTPPAAPSMYWALDVALPDGTSPARTEFNFVLDDLEVSQAFGGGRRGRILAEIRGIAIATAEGSIVTVRVERLTVTTKLAEVFEDVEDQACLRELVPWGWTVDPANGSKIARTLVLASLYAFLSEVVRRGNSQTWRTLAERVYALGWYLLFGVNPMAAVDEVHRRKLADLILALYQRWCDGFAYPGPRCSDEHHGVYLGCVELSRSGAIRSFDAWQHRRHVVTGPLLEHYAQQLGIAPIDVIAGRFAGAMCCLAGLPPLTLPPLRGEAAGGLAGDRESMFHVGTAASVDRYARSRGAAVTWMAPAALSLRMTEAFTMRTLEGRPVEVLASSLPDGGSFAIAVPRAEKQLHSPKIRDEVLFNLRRTETYVREAGREAVADFTVEVMRAAPPTALLEGRASDRTRKLAEAVAKAGVTAADVAEDGARATLVRSGMPDSAEHREAAADLVEHAEKAVDGVVRSVVKVLGSKVDRSAFGVAANQKKLAEAITDKVIPELSAAAVAVAADRTAKG